MPERYIFSREGYSYFQKQLSSRKEAVAVAGKAVGEAAGPNCDWHDNFEYDDAKRRLEMASTRAAELQIALGKAEIIDIIEQSVRVAVGNTIEIEYEDGEEREFTIGAYGESNPGQGLVSYVAPLAKAVLGKTEGDEGTLKQTFTINRIHPSSYKYRGLIRALFEDNNPETK